MTPIKATYTGFQESIVPWLTGFDLWTILEPCEGHPVHSTLSITILHHLGFEPYQPEED